MDKTFVKAIQETNEKILSQLHGLDHAAALVPDSMSLQSLEAFQQYRNRYRASFKTALVEDFAAYVKDNGGTVCFLNPETRTARTIFDLGTLEQPGHWEHKAVLMTAITPEFHALESANGQMQPHRSFIEFMEDWRAFWSAVDAEGNEIPQPKAIAALRSMTVENITKAASEVDDMAERRSSMESIEARSQEVQIHRFLFDLVPLEGFSIRRIECRFGFRAHNGLHLGISIIGKGQLDKELSEEFQAIVAEQLPDLTIYKGEFTG